ncbi:protein IMPACT isoform X1 [Falco rusticolus]|uniref:protein IMPACT isoform X1 n=1 Tax=Falco rusticolus TaxID=120794 RepID=UPI00188693B5|nr:protein IMPACT isoform X1 [Falco rusticolus]XP_055559532.1 protein IMPACT isoform X1 [Falco cherrug]
MTRDHAFFQKHTRMVQGSCTAGNGDKGTEGGTTPLVPQEHGPQEGKAAGAEAVPREPEPRGWAGRPAGGPHTEVADARTGFAISPRSGRCQPGPAQAGAAALPRGWATTARLSRQHSASAPEQPPLPFRPARQVGSGTQQRSHGHTDQRGPGQAPRRRRRTPTRAPTPAERLRCGWPAGAPSWRRHRPPRPRRPCATPPGRMRTRPAPAPPALPLLPQVPMAAGDAEVAQQQIDEIEALSSIYGEDWCVVDEDEKIYCIKINDCLDQPKWTICLQVILPPGYPTAEPPIYQLNAPWLRREDYMELANSLEEIYVQNLGESILYLWVEKIREVLIEKARSSDQDPDIKKTSEEVDEDDGDDFLLDYQPIQEEQIKMLNYITSENQEVDEELPSIHHGNPITDRRSTFQAHLAPVVTLKQVKRVLEKLNENKKIASATHNIYAYRIYCEDKQTFLQDCEDDGETAAGGRLLHLMQILNVHNVLVVVSRWYGGILLGPDRFKHINNCARNVLVEYNYVPSVEESSKQAGKSKKIRKDKKRTEH